MKKLLMFFCLMQFFVTLENQAMEKNRWVYCSFEMRRFHDLESLPDQSTQKKLLLSTNKKETIEVSMESLRTFRAQLDLDSQGKINARMTNAYNQEFVANDIEKNPFIVDDSRGFVVTLRCNENDLPLFKAFKWRDQITCHGKTLDGKFSAEIVAVPVSQSPYYYHNVFYKKNHHALHEDQIAAQANCQLFSSTNMYCASLNSFFLEYWDGDVVSNEAGTRKSPCGDKICLASRTHGPLLMPKNCRKTMVRVWQ